jgi:outer membrane receptor protein involved in Fe transport
MNTFRVGRNAPSFMPLVLVLGVTVESNVFAQEAQQGQGVPEEIVVTGSRIVRRDFSSQSPLVTVDQSAFTERSNVGLEATLNQLPQFNTTNAGSQAAASAAGTPFPQANAAPGAATVNLRGLGLNRSLVLFNGRRLQPINGQLVVDLNTLPAAAIDRVEVISGGAAAVYGADAIAGVVNVITKKDFEGVQFNMQSSINQEGDGNETSLSGVLGASFADGRGSVMVGADYSDRETILGKNRDWVVAGWNDPGTTAGGIGSSNLSQFQPDLFNPPTGAAAFPLVGATYVVDQNGAIFDASRPLNPAHPYTGPLGGTSGFKINSDGTLGWNDQDHSYLQIPLERYSIFGSGHMKLTDNIDVFTELHYSDTFTKASGFTSSVFNVWSPTVPYNSQFDNPALATFGQGTSNHPVPPQLAALLSSRTVAPFAPPGYPGGPNAPWTYVGGLDYLGNFTTETTSNVYQAIGGLRSDFTVGSHDWRWEIYASHGSTSVNARQPEGFPFKPRLQNLFNADQYGTNFDISSLPGFVNLAVTGHCTSGLPIFNPDGSVNNRPSVTQDCSDYVVLRMNSITSLTQDVVEGSLTGEFGQLASGPIGFAVGADYREENFAFDPDSGYNANQDFPNVIQNIILPVSVDGSTNVKEIFAEMSIPLLKNRIEIDPGVRFSDYDTVGNVTTYKLLGDFKVNDWFKFRGGHQFANRAPNVNELFTPPGGSALVGGNDACAYYPANTQSWGNRPENPNRLNLQTLCQFLMTREGAPPSLYVPGGSANTYNFNVFGATFFFPFTIAATQGNPNLESESAGTTTAGFVVTLATNNPLTISLDWFKIKLDNAIDAPGHDSVYQQCLDAKYNPLIGSAPGSLTGAQLAAGNPFCAKIQREYVGGAPFTPGNFGAARKYDAQTINTGGILSRGYDLAVNWGIGNFNVNVDTSFLDTYEQSPFPGAGFVDYTGTLQNLSYDYRMFSTVGYNRGNWSAGLRWQHLPSIDPAPGTANFGTDAHDQFDVFGSWNFGNNQRYSLRGGIDNLLNADPEIVGATATNRALGSTNAVYDQFGRRLFIGLSVTL